MIDTKAITSFVNRESLISRQRIHPLELQKELKISDSALASLLDCDRSAIWRWKYHGAVPSCSIQHLAFLKLQKWKAFKKKRCGKLDESGIVVVED